MKKNWHPRLSRSKIDFRGSPRGGTPKLRMSKYLSLIHRLIFRKLATLLEPFKKIIFWGPILGKFPEEWPQKISEDKLALTAQ